MVKKKYRIKKRIKKIKQSKPAQKVSRSVKAVKKKARIEESQELKQFMKLPDYFTLANAFSGILAIFLAFYEYFLAAIFFMFLSVILDRLDGAVARKIERQGNFGKEIDSLADIISFGVAPVVFGMTVMSVGGVEVSLKSAPFILISFLFFLGAGILRLARYNVTEMKGYYYGMPITLNALIIPFVYLIHTKVEFYPYIYLILGFLMIIPFKVKKIL
jgi:CDP-diacylglycerol--serine O-phosphatidyltransferase